MTTRNPWQKLTPYLDPGFVEAGGYRLHYALTLASDLPAVIAGSYGIQPRPNLAVLTIAIAPRDPGAGAPLADARVDATAISLTGERTALALSRHDESGGATWIGTVDVRHRVPFTIEIEARAIIRRPAAARPLDKGVPSRMNSRPMRRPYKNRSKSLSTHLCSGIFRGMVRAGIDLAGSPRR